MPTGGDTLLLPAGTRLDTRGEATAPLASAAWATGARRAPLTVTGGRFTGSFVPSSSGEYRLAVVDRRRGAADRRHGAACHPAGGDSAPQVEMPVPGADTLAPLSLQLPLVVDARDDHGVSAVHGREPAGQPARGRGSGPPRQCAGACRERRTARSSPTRSTSPVAGCCRATPSAMRAVAADNTPHRQSGGPANSCSGCPP